VHTWAVALLCKLTTSVLRTGTSTTNGFTYRDKIVLSVTGGQHGKAVGLGAAVVLVAAPHPGLLPGRTGRRDSRGALEISA